VKVDNVRGAGVLTALFACLLLLAGCASLTEPRGESPWPRPAR